MKSKDNSRKLAIISILSIVLVIVLSFTYNHYKDSSVVTVNLKNIKRLDIYKEEQFAEATKKTATINKSQSIRLKHGSYYFDYKGRPDHQSEHVKIDIDQNTTTVNISAHPTIQAQNRILEREIDSINQVIKDWYPNIINNYIINRGSIYNDNWYGATLTYNGDDPFIADSLKVVLQKKDGQWLLRTDPPSILLNTHDFPHIPIEVIRKVNENQNSAIPQKYIDM